MDNNFIMTNTGVNTPTAQNLANELFKKFPNMTPKNPADVQLEKDIKEDVKEDFAKAQDIALATDAGRKALQEFEEVKKRLIDELISQTPQGAEALKKYRDKILAIYKDNEALKVEQATRATDELNEKYKALQKENESIKAKLDEVLKKIDSNTNKPHPSPTNVFATNKPAM